MQYQAHSDFLPSLRDFYHKNGNYRKAANKVLAAWARSQNQTIFSEHHVFQDFNLTHHGEDRVNHCFKYELYNFSRLVTQQHQQICTFLFVGTHQEVDKWLDKNKGLLVKSVSQAQPPQTTLSSEKNYTRTDLVRLRESIVNIKNEINQYKNNFENTDIASSTLSEAAQQALVNQFHFNNTAYFNSQLIRIRQLAIQKNTIKAIEQAENLELFTDFLKLKVKYIATLKEYLEVSNNLH